MHPIERASLFFSFVLPLVASVVVVGWQTYMPSVSYDSSQHSTMVTREEVDQLSVKGGAEKT